MNGNTKKIGTLLATMALFMSMLLVSIPVGADTGTDVYVKAIQVGSATPTIGDNITVSADIQAADANCTNVKVTFEAVNGTTIVGLGFTTVATNVSNATAVPVAWYWNSTVIVPDPALVYDIKVTLTLTGDTNQTNDTMTLPAAVDWKAPKLAVTAVAGADDALIGDDYTATVTVKNIGDANFMGVKTFKIMDGTTEIATGELNASATALAPAATKNVDVVIVTDSLAAGAHNFTADLIGGGAYKVVTFATKVTDVSVTDITFTPASGVVKHTQTVDITATVENTGTLDAIDMVISFFVDGVAITGCGTNMVNVSIGDTNETTCKWVTPNVAAKKNYTIKVEADGMMEKNITVLEAPHTHLGVTGIAFTPQTLAVLEEPALTQELNITVTVANTGDKAAVNAVLSITADGTEIYTNNTVAVAAGGQATYYYVYNIATAEADKIVDFNATITLGTDSAYMVKNITVPGDNDKPEYEITALTVTPATSQERGVAANIKVMVKNVGDALGASITLKFKAGTTEIGTKTLENLTVGGAGNETTLVWAIPMTFALGNVEINVTIDGTTVYKNVTYNIIEYKKPVLGASFAKDKKGKVIGYSSSAAEGASKTLKVKVDVTNTGSAEAKTIQVVLKDSKGKVLVTYNATGTIAAGATQQYIIEVKMKAGASTKLTAEVTCVGVHNDAQAAAVTATPASAKVVKTPGFEVVVLAAAVAVALVVLSRRRK